MRVFTRCAVHDTTKRPTAKEVLNLLNVRIDSIRSSQYKLLKWMRRKDGEKRAERSATACTFLSLIVADRLMEMADNGQVVTKEELKTMAAEAIAKFPPMLKLVENVQHKGENVQHKRCMRHPKHSWCVSAIECRSRRSFASQKGENCGHGRVACGAVYTDGIGATIRSSLRSTNPHRAHL